MRQTVVAALTAGIALCAAGDALAGKLPKDFAETAQACAPQIHPVTMAAVVRQESGGNPYAIGVNRGTARLKRQPTTAQEAIATATWLKSQGHDFDGGLAQINVRNLGWLGLSVADLFDPCKNLQAAQAVLADCYTRAARSRLSSQSALHAALSCYNTGNFTRGFSNGYVAKVTGQVAVVGDGVTAPAGAAGGVQAVAPQGDDSPTETREGDVFGRGVGDAFSARRAESMVTDQVILRNAATFRPVSGIE